MKEKIIGRTDKQRILQKIFDSNKAEFLAIYGRRRVRKTYLIKQLFYKTSCWYFKITGVTDGSLACTNA